MGQQQKSRRQRYPTSEFQTTHKKPTIHDEDKDDTLDDLINQQNSRPATGMNPKTGALLPRAGKSYTLESAVKGVDLDSITTTQRLQFVMQGMAFGMNAESIAEILQVSVSTVYKDRTEVKARMRKQAQSLDVNELIGMDMAFNQSIQNIAMMIAGDALTNNANKLAALKTAMASRNNTHKLMSAAGVFDALKYRQMASDGSKSDMQVMLELTKSLFTDEVTQADAERIASSEGRNELGEGDSLI